MGAPAGVRGPYGMSQVPLLHLPRSSVPSAGWTRERQPPAEPGRPVPVNPGERCSLLGEVEAQHGQAQALTFHLDSDSGWYFIPEALWRSCPFVETRWLFGQVAEESGGALQGHWVGSGGLPLSL